MFGRNVTCTADTDLRQGCVPQTCAMRIRLVRRLASRQERRKNLGEQASITSIVESVGTKQAHEIAPKPQHALARAD